MSYLDYYVVPSEVELVSITEDIQKFYNYYKAVMGHATIEFMYSDKLPEWIPARIFVMPLISRYKPEAPDFYVEINLKAWAVMPDYEKNYLIENICGRCRIDARGNIIPRIYYPKSLPSREKP